MMNTKIIECPRDAMQGLLVFIPTNIKVQYINSLLKVGFDTIDLGSFVSPKSIPQMRDTEKVLSLLDASHTSTKLLTIIANFRGAQTACRFDRIDYLGFPLSLSEIFQQKNTNQSIAEAIFLIDRIQQLCLIHGKKLVCYVSMGFGNPYHESYSEDTVIDFIKPLYSMGIDIVSLADTVGLAQPKQITRLLTALLETYTNIEWGVHLHSDSISARNKVEAAYQAGCRRFDGALRGWGGCPMAHDDMVGNIATERLCNYLIEQGEKLEPLAENIRNVLPLTEEVFAYNSR